MTNLAIFKYGYENSLQSFPTLRISLLHSEIIHRVSEAFLILNSNSMGQFKGILLPVYRMQLLLNNFGFVIFPTGSVTFLNFLFAPLSKTNFVSSVVYFFLFPQAVHEHGTLNRTVSASEWATL